LLKWVPDRRNLPGYDQRVRWRAVHTGPVHDKALVQNHPELLLLLGSESNYRLVWLGCPVPTTLGKYLVFTQNLFAPHPSFFPEAWSLAIEEIFYFLLPLCFFAIWAILRKPMVALIVTLTLLLSASMLLRYYGAVEATNWDEQVRKVALFRIDSLMWGFCLRYYTEAFPETDSNCSGLPATFWLPAFRSRSTQWLMDSLG
jgi:hypothetical protein